MAYSSTGFATIGASKSGNAVSLYAYSTADTIADVNTSGYFNDLSDTLQVGDVILVSFTSTGGNSSIIIGLRCF